MKHDPEKYRKIFNSMSLEEIQVMNKKNHDEHLRQATEFKAAYNKGECYLCGKSFKTISKETPCLHWLLRQGKFKPKDFPLIYAKYGYHNLAAFIRWCANEERLLSNINDLTDEKGDRKILSYTVKWKNIDWTFDCSNNDFQGHVGSHIDYPHYHFQMRIDGRQFINFNDFHVPFTDEDLFILTLKENESEWFKQGFGAIGSGMQDAVSVSPEDIIKHAETATEEDATYHFSTIVDASESPITGEELTEMMEEAKKTGKSLSYTLNQRMKGRANIQTIISPADSIPDIAYRTEHKRR